MDDNLIRFDKKSRFLFVDFETENLCLNYRFNKPWQMAMLMSQNGEELWSRDIRVNFEEGINFSKGALPLAHSFCKEKQENGLTPKAAAETLKEALENTEYLVGHNILGFDIFIAKALFDHAGIEFNNFPQIIDTLAISKGVKGNLPYQKGDDLLFYQIKMINERIRGSKTKLSDMAAYFNIELDPAQLHDGLYDLRINLKIWNQLKYQVNF